LAYGKPLAERVSLADVDGRTHFVTRHALNRQTDGVGDRLMRLTP
jgi:hypothetical protein